MKLYVGNLPYTVTDEQLNEIFSEYGEVESASLIVDKFSNQSKGFGFVEMPSNAAADTAIKALNETQMGGRQIKVNQAKPKSNSRR
jgi:RNA recognition motif-containing protein